MNNQSKLQIVPAHPALVRLDEAVKKLRTSRVEYARVSEWIDREAEPIDPTRWTQKIEAALDDPAALESLRVKYDEKSLTFISSCLRETRRRHEHFENMREICDAIRGALEVFDGIGDKGPDVWLKPLFKAAVLIAQDEHCTPLPRGGSANDHEGLFRRADGILRVEFAKLALWLGKYSNHLLVSYQYPSDPVIQGKKYDSMLNADVDLRAVSVVPFVDCVNSKHPDNENLYRENERLEMALQETREQVKSFRSDSNGSVNERQHAARLIDMLHGAQDCYRAADANTIEAQNRRRWQYEAQRHHVLLSIRRLREQRDVVIAALCKAAAECVLLLELTDTSNPRNVVLAELLKELDEIQSGLQPTDTGTEPRVVTIDQQETARICMNNCLAIDARLRFITRELESLQREYNRDLSNGAGVRALDEAFAKLDGMYRWKPTTGGGHVDF